MQKTVHQKSSMSEFIVFEKQKSKIPRRPTTTDSEVFTLLSCEATGRGFMNGSEVTYKMGVIIILWRILFGQKFV